MKTIWWIVVKKWADRKTIFLFTCHKHNPQNNTQQTNNLESGYY